MRISDVIARKGNTVDMIDHGQPVRDVARLMNRRQIGAIVVVNAETRRPMGMVSQSEIVAAVDELGHSALGHCATGIMRRPAPHCTPDMLIQDAMAKMTRERARHLTVLDTDGAMLGLVSLGDLVAARLGSVELEASVLRDMARTQLMVTA